MTTDLYRLSATDAVQAIASGRLSSESLMLSCLDRIEAVESKVKAWVCRDRGYALEQARAVDKLVAVGKPIRRLSGIPVGVKDVFNSLFFPTQMGSEIWKGFKAGNDARVVSVLRLDGALIPGKTVTSEFAVHWPGPTRNPHNLDHTPGTSSSGSVAAVAAGMVPVALCTQTAGSTIRPASFCGVYGMKPSFGMVPRTGMIKTTDTLDHVGFCARTVDDIALMLDVLRVHGMDYPVVHERVRDERPIGIPWRVAVVKGPFWSETEDYARIALSSLAVALGKAGMQVEERELPEEFATAYSIHADIYDSCLAYYFQDESHQPDRISPRLKEMVAHGRQVTSAQYAAALERQTDLSRSLDRFFEECDVILTLSSNGEAPKGEERADQYDTCLTWTLCGVPALTAPVFTGPGGLPFGAQLVARKYDDLKLLRFVKDLERVGAVPLSATVAEVR